MMQYFSAILLAFSVAGCRVPLPEQPGQPISMPAQWASGSGGTNVISSDWWSKFGDARLSRLVHEALAHNINLQATATRLDQAVLYADAEQNRIPALDVSLNTSKQQSNFIGMPFGDGGVLKSRYTSHGLNLGTSWEVDVWGRIKAGEKRTITDVQAAHADLWAARQSLAAQVVKAWIGLVEANEQIDLARTNIVILENTVKQAALRHSLGVNGALDVQLAEVNLATVRALYEQWRAAHAQQCRRLEALLGRYPSGTLQGGRTLPELMPPVPAGVPSGLLQRRPDIAASMARVRGAHYRVEEAQGELLPKLNLTASTGSTSDALQGLLNNNHLVWSLGSNITQPILKGRKLRNNVLLQHSLAAETVLRHRQLVLGAFAEVESSLANEGLLQKREHELSDAAVKASRALELAEHRYRRGLTPFVTVLETQRRYTETRSQRVSVRRLRLENRANLHLALGGDFLEPTPVVWGGKP